MGVKLAVIYYSTYGTNHRMAEIAVEAGRAAGAETRLLKCPETAPAEVIAGTDAWAAHAEHTAHVPPVTLADLEWADAYLFSAPTRFGGQPSQVRSFIDTLGGAWLKGIMAGKGFSAMTSSKVPHGGQEQTLMSFYTTAMHWGCIIVAPGYTNPVIFKTGGNPYGYSHCQDQPFSDDARAAIAHQTRRLIEVTKKLVG